MSQDKVSRLSDVGDTTTSGKNVKTEYKPSYGDRWDKARASKKVVFGIAAGAVILTLIVGFYWGGWVTGGAANTMANDAVTQRLASICVGQFNQDPQKAQKLVELSDASPYRRDDYVKEQGWATMPGEAEPNSKVADSCAKLIYENGQ
jgi:hypothetical protein